MADLEGVELVAVGEADHDGRLQARDGDPPDVARLLCAYVYVRTNRSTSVSQPANRVACLVIEGPGGADLDVVHRLLEKGVKALLQLVLLQARVPLHALAQAAVHPAADGDLWVVGVIYVCAVRVVMRGGRRGKNIFRFNHLSSEILTSGP
jgi:hypothetical protein